MKDKSTQDLPEDEKSSNPDLKNNDSKNQLGKLLDKFKIRVSNQEFEIEIFNHDLTDDSLKTYSVLVNGKKYTVEVESMETEAKSIGHDLALKSKSTTPSSAPVEIAKPVETAAPMAAKATERADTAKILNAPMPGKILEIKTNVGDSVEAGQPLVILEAMKMENVMTAPVSGTVKEIPIQVGINVIQGDELVIIE